MPQLSVKARILIGVAICAVLVIGFGGGYYWATRRSSLPEPEAISQTSVEWKTFKTSEYLDYGFEIQYPASWTVAVDLAPAADNYEFYGHDPEADEGANTTFGIQISSTDETNPVKYAQNFYPAGYGYPQISSTTFYGYPAAGAFSEPQESDSYFIIHNGSGFYIGGSPTDLVQDIKKTFKITK